MAETFAGDDLSDAIDLLTTGRYKVTRSSPASVDASGRRVAPASTTFEATGVLWPLQGKELERLPEGLRNREVQKLITSTELRTLETTMPDVLTIDGYAWEVAKVAAWRGGNFFECTIARRPG